MKTSARLVAFLAAGLGLATAATAAAAQSPRELFEHVIPAELVLAHAEAIGLDAKQREAVERIQADVRPRVPRLLSQMRTELDTLLSLLKEPKPDDAAVLAQFEKLNAVETEFKRLRIQMTLGVKKVLTAPQQENALRLQREQLAAGASGAGADTVAAKLRRVKEGLEQWKREGRDVGPLRELWDRFRAAEENGHYRQARQALDEAIALLDAPPPRP